MYKFKDITEICRKRRVPHKVIIFKERSDESGIHSGQVCYTNARMLKDMENIEWFTSFRHNRSRTQLHTCGRTTDVLRHTH